MQLRLQAHATPLRRQEGVHLQQGRRQLDGGRTEACNAEHFEHRVPAEAVCQVASWEGCQWHTYALNALDKAYKLHKRESDQGLGKQCHHSLTQQGTVGYTVLRLSSR